MEKYQQLLNGLQNLSVEFDEVFYYEVEDLAVKTFYEDALDTDENFEKIHTSIMFHEAVNRVYGSNGTVDYFPCSHVKSPTYDTGTTVISKQTYSRIMESKDLSVIALIDTLKIDTIWTFRPVSMITKQHIHCYIGDSHDGTSKYLMNSKALNTGDIVIHENIFGKTL